MAVRNSRQELTGGHVVVSGAQYFRVRLFGRSLTPLSCPERILPWVGERSIYTISIASVHSTTDALSDRRVIK